MSFKKQWAMILAVAVWRHRVKQSLGVLWMVSAMVLASDVARAQIIELDFDTSGPTSTDELPNFFDLFGFDADFGTNWTVDPNTVNSDNATNALHTVSNGNQLEAWFSRVAIVKPDVFAGGANVELSADITWDDNDNAGLYVRFFGSSDVPLENEFYHVRAEGTGGANAIRLHKVKGGVNEVLIDQTDAIAVTEGDTHNLRIRTSTVGDTVEIFVSLDDQPLAGMDPFVDATNPILNAGRVGVGQETNPTFFDNIIINGLDNINPGDFNADGTVDLADFAIMAANFQTSPATFEQGDNNFDRRVDLRDFIQVRKIFNAPAQGASSVPEPAGLTLALTGMAMIAAARRRRPTIRRGDLPYCV